LLRSLLSPENPINNTKVNPFKTARYFLLGTALASVSFAAEQPPEGFVNLFNGTNLDGWRGGSTFDHRKLLAMPEAERKAQIDKWTATMTQPGKDGKPHWRVENGELVNDGFGDYATTTKDYGDFELLLEYKTVPKADSGIYLRGVPQVQIWDSTENDKKSVELGKPLGSGGLWNNSPGAAGKDPLVKADKPFGEWNKFRIVMVGSRVSVWLNDKLVVDHVVLENYYDRKIPVPSHGPIQLQTHGGEIRWRNIFLKEIKPEEANRILSEKGGQAFKQIWNGKNFDGWAGDVADHEVKDGNIIIKDGKSGTLYWNKELSDFTARLEFNTPPGGNNGLAIRHPGQGNPSQVAMCELQVLDDNAEKYAKLDPRQYHGGAYGMAAAHRGYTRPAGEWNFQEVTVKGSTISVELNGVKILNTDISKLDPATFMDGKDHPGRNRKSGFFGFAGHNDPVKFRNISVLEIPAAN
jgi:hypothetical protein